MRPSKISFAITIVPTAITDVWMVYQHPYGQIGRIETTSYGTSFDHDMEPWTCKDDIFTRTVLPVRWDIGGDDYGIQIDESISEFSTTADCLHNASYAMFDANNEKSGQCYLNQILISDFDF
ncbi:hypothetical protein GGR51DRAFT_556578 [Nemania sp. FL0031]|nr:hypothetical protein GGR51DRAFT_556578 [Nemania sp. FL0031]